MTGLPVASRNATETQDTDVCTMVCLIFRWIII
jgi:hypothetical protein